MNNIIKESVHKDGRISILDGFRTIAILSVIFYHYFYRWNDSKYPYFGGSYFHYGFKGVPFFFMISGFVICYSLEGTKNFISFWKKRFIRLFPSIVIASILTYCFLLIFDNYDTFPDNHLRNVIVSITFLPPALYNFIIEKPDYFSYINYDYWSLWPEIQFYFLASSIYFINKKNFKRNFLVICFALIVFYKIAILLNFDQIKYFQKFTNLFNLIKHLVFFLSGALFYMLYKNKIQMCYVLLLSCSFIFINLFLSVPEFIASLIMYSLFFCFIYKPEFLKVLEGRIFLTIGISSYFLYLIHEYVGIVWIRNIVSFFYPHSFIVPILIIIVMTVFSIIYTQKIESKITRYLQNSLLKRKNA